MISKCKSSLKSLVNNKTIKTNNLTIFHKFPKNRNYMNKIRIIIKNNKNNLVFLKTNITKPLFNQSKININQYINARINALSGGLRRNGFHNHEAKFEPKRELSR